MADEDRPDARGERERRAQEALDAPSLGAKVYGLGTQPKPMVLDPEDYPADPFLGLYEDDLLDEAGKPDEKAVDEFVRAHGVDFAVESRKRQRERLLSWAEEETRTAFAKREGPVDPADVETAVELAKQEVLVPHGLQVEDDRAGVVETVSRNLIISPPFHPGVLEQLASQNNALGQLVNAMEINIDATGWEIVPRDSLKMEEEIEEEVGPDPDPVVDPEGVRQANALRAEAETERLRREREFQEEVDRQVERLEGFFREPWPGVSFTTIRRQLRYDLETTGNAYLEVLRNLAGDVVFARFIDAKLMRIVRLDQPITVTKRLERGGAIAEFDVVVRERRFVQQVGGGALVPRFRHSGIAGGTGAIDPNATGTELDTRSLFTNQGVRIIYFKEFGATRDLDMWTGQWSSPGTSIPPDRRATEILHFKVKKDARTPYGLPRWINQLPSVLGSRKAEEFNLSFFKAGGVPPLLITVSGGQLAQQARDDLEKRFNTQNPAHKHQAVILEVLSSGRMDKQQKVAVNVERFGSEKMQDAMFLRYDERTHDLVRFSFRLPPIFEGDAESHNFATARASYLVAEAQVFAPERDEFDEIVNLRLLRAMGGENFKFRSLPLVVDDADLQVKCIEVAAENALVGGDQLVSALNKVCNLELRFDQDANDAARGERMARARAVADSFARVGTGGEPPREARDAGGSEDFEEIQRVAKAADLAKVDGLVALGMEVGEALAGGLASARSPHERRALRKVLDLYQGLDPAQRRVVERVATQSMLGGDSAELRDLLSCAASILADPA